MDKPQDSDPFKKHLAGDVYFGRISSICSCWTSVEVKGIISDGFKFPI